MLSGKPDPATLAHWAEIGVTDVAFGMPDRDADEVVAYLGRLRQAGPRRWPGRLTRPRVPDPLILVDGASRPGIGYGLVPYH